MIRCMICDGRLEMNLDGSGATCAECGVTYPLALLRQMLMDSKREEAFQALQSRNGDPGAVEPKAQALPDSKTPEEPLQRVGIIRQPAAVTEKSAAAGHADLFGQKAEPAAASASADPVNLFGYPAEPASAGPANPTVHPTASAAADHTGLLGQRAEPAAASESAGHVNLFGHQTEPTAANPTTSAVTGQAGAYVHSPEPASTGTANSPSAGLFGRPMQDSARLPSDERLPQGTQAQDLDGIIGRIDNERFGLSMAQRRRFGFIQPPQPPTEPRPPQPGILASRLDKQLYANSLSRWEDGQRRYRAQLDHYQDQMRQRKAYFEALYEPTTPEYPIGTWKMWFEAVLKKSFPGYTVKKDVPLPVLTGGGSNGRRIDLVLEKDGAPALAIFLTRRSNHLKTMDSVKAAGIPALRFVTRLSNRREYVVDRVGRALKS